MSRKVALARSARLLGIDRHLVQRLIREGRLASCEGMVDLDDLERFFPGAASARNSFAEDLEVIKRTAFSRRVSERAAPDHDTLERRLRKADTDLAVARARGDRYQTIVEELLRWLAARQGTASEGERALMGELNRWLLDRLKDQGGERKAS